MSFFKFALLAFICVIGLALVQPSHAQNSQQDYLDAHNAARVQVGVANMTWDTTVANYALNYANQRKVDCALTHSSSCPYGENLAKGSGSFTGLLAVGVWVDEKPYYVYSSNTCVTGKVCKDYTNVVWSTSVKLGCARVLCNSGSYFVTCNYDLAGNFPTGSPY